MDCKKAMVYTVLFTILCTGGCLLESIIQYTQCPQYVCNFIFGFIITLYAMENLTLFADLNKCKELLKNEGAHIATINHLAAQHNTLKRQNSNLKEELEKLHEMEKFKLLDESSIPTEVKNLRNAWVFYCDAKNFDPPPKIFLASPKKYMNEAHENIPSIDLGQ
jgi:hypothetical protein